MSDKPPILLEYKSPGQPRRRYAIYWCIAATLAAAAIGIALHKWREPKQNWVIIYSGHPVMKDLTVTLRPDNK